MRRAGAGLRYFLADAADEWRRRPGPNLLATATLASVLFVGALALLAYHNVRTQVETWSRDVRVAVILRDGAAEAARTDLRRILAADPGVRSVEFVDRDEALRRFRAMFPDVGRLPDELGANPLPASVEAILDPGAGSTECARRLAAQLKNHPAVEEVRYDGDWLSRLERLVATAGKAGGMLAAGVLLAVALVVAGVLRLSVLGRRDEIEIMLLVGATRGLIRGPFLVSGAVQGAVGGSLALVLVEIGRRLLWAGAGADAGPLLALVAGRPLTAALSLLAVATGIAVGTLSAWFAVGSIDRLER